MPVRGEPEPIPQGERAFFVEEFRDVTMVIALPILTDEGIAAVSRTITGFAQGHTRFVLVVGSPVDASRLRVTLPDLTALSDLTEPAPSAAAWTDEGLTRLWLAVADHSLVVAVAEPGDVAETAGILAAGVRATKVVLTDPGGGGGDPPRSFAELELCHDDLLAALVRRGLGNLLPAAEAALRGGAYSVNICRAEDLELELFTFDGAGTLITLGGYLTLDELRVDDLPAVEGLVSRGVADGVLKPRGRSDIARMAVGGLGARVLRTGHLAGIVGLHPHAYTADGVGEVSGLITVSAFSGAGAGALLLDGLVHRAGERGLRAVFAVTISDTAARFFVRNGFREVGRDEVPPSKWHDYDQARLVTARCFWRDIPTSGTPA